MKLKPAFANKRNLTRHRIYCLAAPLAAAAVIGSSFVAAGTGVASAATGQGQIVSAGSFTTFEMMNNLFPNSVLNIDPLNVSPPVSSISTGLTNGLATCQTNPFTAQINGSGAGKAALATEEQTVTPTPMSLAQAGCLTIARSSSPPEPQLFTPADSLHFDYYAYALDGVAPLVGSDSVGTDLSLGDPVNFPINLTLTQVRDIYSCNADYLDWGGTATGGSGLTGIIPGGGSGHAIVRMWPQAGSGTRAVYQDVLGFDPTTTATVGGVPGVPSCTSTVGGVAITSVAGVPNEENLENAVIANGSTATAIYIYSAGQFARQWNDPTDFPSASSSFSTALSLASVNGHNYVDTATGTGSGSRDSLTESIDGTTVSEAHEWYSHIASNTAAPSSSSEGTTNTGFPGIRYVYNVADTETPGYDAGKALVGFDNQATGVALKGTTPEGVGAVSALCLNADSNVITASGFLPLAQGGAPANDTAKVSDQANTTCREFPGGSYPGLGGSFHWIG
jgi:hypothetical protein